MGNESSSDSGGGGGGNDKTYVTGCGEGGYYSSITEHSDGSTTHSIGNLDSAMSGNARYDSSGRHTGSSISTSSDTGQSVDIVSTGK
jgi:hypothetical protein